jgi:type IV pilus assembly protein PilY1
MKKILGLSLIFMLVNTPIAIADDTEIFTGIGSVKDSNVLFILDTSGSMNDPETLTRPPYDSSTVYDNSKYSFNSNLYYLYKSFNSLDAVASNIRQNDVAESQIICSSALSAAQTTGIYSGRTIIRGNTTNNKWWGPTYDWILTWIDQNEHNNKTINSTDTSLKVDCGETSGWGGFLNAVYYEGYFARLYSGNYLNYLAVEGESDTTTRMAIMKRAAIDALGSLDENINVGIMRFDTDSEGGRVIAEMQPAREHIQTLSNAINSLTANGGTPLSETMYEAGLYMTSSPAHYSARTGTGNNKSIQAAFAKNSNTQFEMPDLSNSCGVVNKIVLFTDGEPSNDNSANDQIAAQLSGLSLVHDKVAINNPCNADESGVIAEYDGKKYGHCMEEAAFALYKKYGIITDTIGGFSGAQAETTKTKLENTAFAGGGSFASASSYDTVRDAFQNTAGAALESPSTFTAPAIAVSSYNSLQLSDNLFYAVFAPNNSGAWAGNLKHYKISSKGIVDKKGKVAVADNGFFNDESVSFWSTTDTVDGSDVRKGGAAEQFGNVSARNIKIIDTSGSLVQATTDSILSLSNNLLGLNDLGLADAILNTTNDITYKLGIANWISGLTPDGTSNRLEMEDAIHSRPIVINYSNNKSIVFIGTNGGYLHAFDTSNGREVFSLMPHEVLPNALGYVDPSRTSVQNKIYGLDGAITYWHNDINLNGVVDGNDTVYLYVGMRRGGHSYYAFNITNPDSPSLLWQKNGNYLNNNKNIPTVSDGYSRLGQTWSSLKPALVNWNNNNKVVLFAGGGYDPAEDGSANARFDHTTGNTVYMIDAIDGTVLWDAYNDVSGVSNEMKSSFAGDVTPVDRNNDGYVDLLYAADTGGRLWRFDFRENSNTFTGGVIADINNSETNGVSENRRFYVSPDVAFIKTTSPSEVTLDDETTQVVNMKDSFILISIGSGYRAHPLSEDVNDHFYLIKDMYGRDFPTSYTTINVSDLAEWSSSDATDQVKSTNGWYFDPPTVGGKIMSPSITLNGVVTFSTFAKGDDNEENSCTGNLGNSLLYQLAPSEEIRNRITCNDGTNSCKPDIPGDTVTSKSSTSRLTATGTLMIIPPKECPEGQTCEPPTCDDYVVSTLSGTTLTEGNMDRCDLFETNYWEEEL